MFGALLHKCTTSCSPLISVSIWFIESMYPVYNFLLLTLKDCRSTGWLGGAGVLWCIFACFTAQRNVLWYTSGNQKLENIPGSFHEFYYHLWFYANPEKHSANRNIILLLYYDLTRFFFFHVLCYNLKWWRKFVIWRVFHFQYFRCTVFLVGNNQLFSL